ncbi:hypothetical protein MSG28_012120 [Choristoneura fumiferana]|uniref:Uncharacterized protein n=1 Tax=Choristoneura fumiferana TaxID=7141 RepID=A0ACC0KBY7_CHOFU|nr:hypothetical protein MSG28_012120 [Choristoneura fumiferana]
MKCDGALGNLAVLMALARGRRRRSRVDLLMTHLAVADVCVTCGVIPLEGRRRRTRVDLLMTHLAVADVCVTCGVIPLEVGH